MDSDDKLAALEEFRNEANRQKLTEFAKQAGLEKFYFIKACPPKIFFGARSEKPNPAALEDACQKFLMMVNIKDFNYQPIELQILTDPREEVALLLAILSPYVNADGGAIELVSVDEKNGRVILNFLGACSGCPHSLYTLKLGIENELKLYLPWINEVLTDDKPSTPNFNFPNLSSDQPDIGGNG